MKFVVKDVGTPSMIQQIKVYINILIIMDNDQT